MRKTSYYKLWSIKRKIKLYKCYVLYIFFLKYGRVVFQLDTRKSMGILVG